MTRLTHLLARIGWTLSRRGAWATLRASAVALGTVCLISGLGSLTLYEASVSQRSSRAQLIQPVLAGPREQAQLLVSHDGFTEILDRPVTVISLWPLSRQAPLPPGVARWPRPGEAVVSPALDRDLLAVGHRGLFGDVAGIISPEGLETATERRVYLVPNESSLSRATMSPARGFAAEGNWSIGPGAGYLNAADPLLSRTLVVGAVILPAIVALIIGGSLDGDSRRRRVQLLDVLGAGPMHRMVVDVAEASRPVATGTVLGAALVGSTMVTDIPLGIVDARLLAADARTLWPAMVAVVAVGPILAMAVILASRIDWRPPRHADPFSSAQTSPRIGWLVIGGVVLCVWLAPQVRDSTQRMAVYLTGLLVLSATLPAVMGMLTSVIAAVISRGRSAAMLLGGRQLAAAPRRTARLTVGVCFAILVVGQAQLWQGIFGVQYHQALQTRASTGNSVLAATYTRFDRPGLASFLSGLPDRVGVAWVSNIAPSGPGEEPTSVLTASCPVLTSLALTCSSGNQVEPRELRSEQALRLVQWTTAAPPVIRAAEKTDLAALRREDARLVLVSTDGAELPVEQLQESAYAEISGGLGLEPLAQGFLTQGTVLRTQGTWIVLLGSLGVLIILMALGSALAGDALGQARSLAPLAVLGERRGWLVTVCLIRSAMPLTVAGAVGSLVYLALAQGLSSPADPVSPSLGLAVGCAAAALVVGVAFAVWSARSIDRRAATWTPGADV